ncbi:hypothetical protein BDF14DRAFT_1984118 [Spinellus fusiger]|nr:hypothetical protein BDF14DRAFT_1984118 [Spinellus fusiger]
MSHNDLPNVECNSQTQDTNAKVPLIEAKTAILLMNNSKLFTKNEYTQWLLKSLFQPVTSKQTKLMEILYLSRNRKQIWHPDYTSGYEAANRRCAAAANTNKAPKPTSTHSSIPAQDSYSSYTVTPRTHILSIHREYRIVYIIDLSSSLATVGNTKADILLSMVFKTMSNSLKGLTQPFSLAVAEDKKAVIRPRLHLTVVADYSQFASNVNIIPMLVAHPTMRVFIQNAIITAENIHSIIEKLDTEFQSFQQDTAHFRKLLNRDRPNVGYNLDVSGQVLDTTSLPSSMNVDSDSTDPNTHQTNLSMNSNSKKENTSYYSSKKEVWGIGKSGADISRILHAGHFALNLLPKEGRPYLILMTDGTMKSNVHDNTFVQQFTEEDITCHIVQIGYKQSFIPGRNFGFIPDTEILQFLSRATGGTFTFSEDCVEVEISSAETPDKEEQEYMSTVLDQKTPQCVRIVPWGDTRCPPPNVYHRKFLFKETYLSKQMFDSQHHIHEDQSPKKERRDGSGPPSLDGRRELNPRHNFPWDPRASPPKIDWCLLKYREYLLPVEFSHIMASRAREGFSLKSITFDRGNGSSKSDTTSEKERTLDFDAVKKERIQISMVMYWQPNITIEYRIRATWLPCVFKTDGQIFPETIYLSNSIFSRAKVPRAEILVRTDTGFAHMLQNWDVFQRRAQMMGVVTGSAYVGEAHTTPMFSKIENLKSYLGSIFERDEALKNIIGFNVLHQKSALHRGSFIEVFQDYWNKLNSTELRMYTRCWYDYACIDMLVGDISPYMSPKFTSTYNQDFVENVEKEIYHSVLRVRDVLNEWADFESSDGTFVRFIHGFVTTPCQEDTTKDYFSKSLDIPPSFCELRIRQEYGRLVTIRLLFFNVDVKYRRRTLKSIDTTLRNSNITNSSNNKICQRPFSWLLMRDDKHFQDISSVRKSEQPSENNSHADKVQKKNDHRSRTWYLPVAMWLTGEYVVRDYLQHMTWTWHTDNDQDNYHKKNKMMPVHDLAFQFLCQARLDQGYQLVLPLPDSTHFYQEISLPIRDDREYLCAVQYFIWKDSSNGKITTEIWIEPSGTLAFDQYELVKKWTMEPDRKTISQLVTFDQIHTVGRLKKKGDFKDKNSPRRDHESIGEDNISMNLPILFDIQSVLRNNKFVVTSFKCPAYKTKESTEKTIPEIAIDNVIGRSLSVETNREELRGIAGGNHLEFNIGLSRRLYSRQSSASPLGSGSGSFSFSLLYDTIVEACPRPDTLLNQNKEAMSCLGPKAQSYAILHYFFECSMKNISDGEIVLKNHDDGEAFYVELKNALHAATSQHISGVMMVSDLQKLRCFVKIYDERSFAVILLPGLDSVISWLSTVSDDYFTCQDTTKLSDDSQRYLFMDSFIFECKRQKPMRPTKSTMLFTGPLDEANRSIIENMYTEDKVTITEIDYPVHQPDGLREAARPKLFEGFFSSCFSLASLSDISLGVVQSVSQAYSISFFKSLYACLLCGFSIDEEDLLRTMRMCNESPMSIDITEFVNSSTRQKNELGDWDCHEMYLQDKFSEIFCQYFEPVKTSNDSHIDLFYYKPASSEPLDTVLNQQHSTLEEKVSSLIELVTNSHIPLLVRLECTYTLHSDKEDTPITELTIPVSYLPTSFSGESIEGKKFNFDDQAIVQGSSPLDSGKVSVTLRLVCLSMPESDNNEYTTATCSKSSIRESLIESMNSQPDCFSMFNQQQKGALAETKARIRWLLTEEIIHILLKVSNITKDVLEYVEYQLGQGSPFVDFPTSTTLPFHFLKNGPESRHTFMNELMKSRGHNPKYSFHRTEDYFYVCEETTYCMREENSLSSGTSPIIRNYNEHNISVEEITSAFESSQGMNNFCEGLGISLNQPSAIEETPTKKTIPFHARPIYWLILIPKEKHVQVYFYSKFHALIDHYEIMRRIKVDINNVQKRTNQIMLLKSLQKTRICSKYLEVSATNDSDYSDSDDESVSNNNGDGPNGSYTIPMPGQYECPVVYTKIFPLHWRLQPNTALKSLVSDVLRLFTVINRSQMFVIEHDESIVYCKFFERNSLHSQDETDTSNRLHHQAGSNTPLISVNDNFSSNSMLGIKQDFSKKLLSSPLIKNTSTKPSSDSKELVLEVHGVDLPQWIEKEFLDLIENRLISHITLNEVQQFFARNPTSRPTLADVNFILPLDKEPTSRQALRVPSHVADPHSLMQHFKQALIASNIRLFSGPIVSDAVINYQKLLFHPQAGCGIQEKQSATPSSSLESIQEFNPGDYCFFYNCIKRVPGSSTVLELSCGQGLAGICVTLVDPNGNPVQSIQANDNLAVYLDPQIIRHSLDDDFQEVSVNEKSYTVWIDVWNTNTVDGNALMQYIHYCYRHVLCDYFIEKITNIDLGTTLNESNIYQKIIGHRSRRYLGAELRKKFIESITYVLQKSTQWKNPTVCFFNRPVSTTPWCMRDIVGYLDSELCKLDINLKPTVAWTSLQNDIFYEKNQETDKKWELYKSSLLSQRQMLQSNIQLVAISGLNDLVERLGSNAKFHEGIQRRSGTSEYVNYADYSRRSSTTSSITGMNANRRFSRVDEISINDHSRVSSGSRSISGGFNKSHEFEKADPLKQCFLIMTIDAKCLSVYTYNWPESISLDFLKGIIHMSARQEARCSILSNILHQKMGLFHHQESIGSTLEQYKSFDNTISLNPAIGLYSGTHSSSNTPSGHVSSPLQTKKPRHVDLSSRNNGIPLIKPPRKYTGTNITVPDIFCLKEMIAYSTIAPKDISESLKNDNSSANLKHVDFDVENSKDLQPSPKTPHELDYVLKDMVAGSVAGIPIERDHDLLRKYGQTFLEAYLKKSRAHAVHQKALKIHKEWRKYCTGLNLNIELSDKMSPCDVNMILRSSRVIHFCRTPLLFSDPEEIWSSCEKESLNKKRVVTWYNDMANYLMSEYAKYLGADMQLIDFDQSDSHLNTHLNSSLFTVAKNMSIEYPSTYFLRILDGGFIMCEISLTSNFVSVTIYSLHRQIDLDECNRSNQRLLKNTVTQMDRFSEKTEKFRQLIRINSFIYDFHLRHAQRTLDAPRDTLPNDLDILNIIRNFSVLNMTPALHSKNRIIHGFYEFESDTSAGLFFGCLIRNSLLHGLSNVTKDRVVVGVSVSGSTLDFSPKFEDPTSNWRYTLIICPASEAVAYSHVDSPVKTQPTISAKILLEYFILVVYQKDSMDNTKDEQNQEKNSYDILQGIDCIKPLHSLDEIVQNARYRIDRIVSEVTFYCKRSDDWRKLYHTKLNNPTSSGGISEEYTEIMKLIRKFERISITEIDRNIRKLFQLKIDWNNALDSIVETKGGSIKEIYEKDYRHVLLYSARYMDFMIHLQLNQHSMIEGWVVSREPKINKKKSREPEREQIANLGRDLCQFLWAETSNKHMYNTNSPILYS